jgi:hypothetical protein
VSTRIKIERRAAVFEQSRRLFILLTMSASYSDMNTFDSTIARSYLRRYFPERNLDYILSHMTPGQLHIWVGSGNNGKSTCANILSKAVSALNPVRASIPLLLLQQTLQIRAPENAIIIVEDGDDWDGTDHRLSAEPLLKLLEAGRTILLITQTLPILEGSATLLADLFERTHVVRFKSKFTKSVEDPAQHKYIAESCIPERLMTEYIKRKIATIPVGELSAPSKKMYRQLVLLAEIKVPIAAPVEANDETVNTSISIILQHKDTSRPDDLLLIEVDPDSDGFYVTLNQNYIGTNCTSRMSYDALGHYLQMLFRATELDVEGYSHVQFNVPLFPATAVSIHAAFDYVAEELGEQIGFLMEDWPYETVKGPYKLRC